MRIQFDKFIDILYSVLNNDEIDEIDITDVMEIINIIFTSKEFTLVASRLDINNYSGQELEKHRFTKKIDSNGMISFEVDEKEREKILKENKVDVKLIQNAVNKRALTKYFTVMYNGLVEFKNDTPSGLYNMQKSNMGDYNTESKIYTDGKISKDVLKKNNEMDSYNRTVKIDDATFTMFEFYINDVINKIELRADFNGDYNVLFYETKRLLSGIDDSFVEVIDESPKVYKFKRH